MHSRLITKSLISFSLIVACTVCVAGPFGKLSILPVKSQKTVKTDDTKVQWINDLEDAHQVSVKSKKPMLIVFGAPWCTFCKKMDRETFSDPKMVKYLKQNFVPVHLDYEKDKHIAEILNVKSLPTTVVLSPDVDLIGFYKGYADVTKMGKQLNRSLLKQSQIAQTPSSTTTK